MGREDTDVDSRKAGYGDSLQHCRDLGGSCYVLVFWRHRVSKTRRRKRG